MRIHQLSAADTIASVHSAPNGLSSDEAVRRLQEFGPNRMEPVAGVPVWLRLLKEFFHFFAVILWVATALAFLGEWNQPGQGMAKIGYAIIAVIVVSGLFSFWQEYRVERTLAALRKLLPQEVEVMRDEKVTSLAVEQLVPGEIVSSERRLFLRRFGSSSSLLESFCSPQKSCASGLSAGNYLMYCRSNSRYRNPDQHALG